MASHILPESEEEAALLVIEQVTVIQRGFLLATVGFGSLIMGCAVTPDDFTQCVKKPSALWLTMTVIVFFGPLTAYIITISLHLHFTDGITLLITACCPADVLSPIFAYYTNSDVCLCLSVFVLSTAMSVGWLPLGVFFCASAFPKLSLAMTPHSTIVIVLIESVCGIGIGMLFRNFKEHWADTFVKFFSWTPVSAVIAMIVIDAIFIPHSIKASYYETVSVVIYLLVMLIGTYFMGLLTGQDQKTCRSMAFCAANKSTLIVLAIIHESFTGYVLVEALPEPTLLLVVYIGLGSLSSVAYQTYQFVRNLS